MKAWFFLLCFLLELTPLLWGGKDLPQFAKLDTDFIYFNLGPMAIANKNGIKKGIINLL